MNQIVRNRAPVASERTRIFASDLVAVARVHQSLEFVLGKSTLETETAVKLAKLAVDVGSLLDCGVTPGLVLAVAAVGLGGSDERLDCGLNGLSALALENRGLADARQAWSDHLEHSPERRTRKDLRSLSYQSAGGSVIAFPN